MSKKDTWSYDFSWTQPYVDMEGFLNGPECRDIFKNIIVEREIDRLEQTDKLVDKMLTFPEAEAILNKIRRQHD